MDKKIVLMELLETVDSIRHGEKGHRNHRTRKKEEECHENRHKKEHKEGHNEKKHRNRMSLPAQNVLCLLLKEGSLNQRSIAKQVHVTGQAISELMKKLESNELVVRTQGEQNNENIINLTPSGQEIAKELESKREKTAEELFRNFTEKEMETLHHLLEKIVQNKVESEGITQE